MATLPPALAARNLFWFHVGFRPLLDRVCLVEAPRLGRSVYWSIPPVSSSRPLSSPPVCCGRAWVDVPLSKGGAPLEAELRASLSFACRVLFLGCWWSTLIGAPLICGCWQRNNGVNRIVKQRIWDTAEQKYQTRLAGATLFCSPRGRFFFHTTRANSMEGERKKLGVRDEGGERKKKIQDGCPRGGRFFFLTILRGKKKIYFPIFSFQCRLSIF